jgi:tRNA(fMet)-specific endonuclease VapC
MNLYVLDSNTISYYFRGVPSVVTQLQSLAPSQLGVPSIVDYELRYGLLRLPHKSAQPRLTALDQLLAPMQYLAFDAPCAEIAASIRAKLEAKGKPIGPHDLLIAATAIRYNGTLITRNLKEFSRVPLLRCQNWHDEP